MDVFRHLFGFDQAVAAELLPVIEHAVTIVDPRLKLTGGYPDHYRKPVLNALEYSRTLALNVPGPVSINLNTYAQNAYVHAIFPSKDFISEAFRASRAIQEYFIENPTSNQAYALMGMRRHEKTLMGVELSGQVIQRDVPQQVVYFNGHTIVDTAPTEAQARDRVAWGFFNNLVDKVAKRISSRKAEMQSQLQELNLLKVHLHTAHEDTRPGLEKELSRLLDTVQTTATTLDLRHYMNDFEDVLLNPEQHLRLHQSPIILDSMGIRQNTSGDADSDSIIFNDLIGFDRRIWTVTMVHCSNMQIESFTSRLETAYRNLCIR